MLSDFDDPLGCVSFQKTVRRSYIKSYVLMEILANQGPFRSICNRKLRTSSPINFAISYES
jgi:hypothetical protein